jgi:hypothetical protein
LIGSHSPSSGRLLRSFTASKVSNSSRVAPGPTTIDDPQTRDRIYDKTKPDSTVRYVNAQIVKKKRMDNVL